MTDAADLSIIDAPNLATIAELAPRLADGSLSAQDLLADCLAAIEASDRRGAALSAIICLNPTAEAEAQALARALRGARAASRRAHAAARLQRESTSV